MKLFAFWEYDLFPYYLGGQVTKMEDGLVETVEYGKGNWHQYTIITTLREGRRIKKELDRISAEYSEMKDKLLKEYLRKRNSIKIGGASHF